MKNINYSKYHSIIQQHKQLYPYSCSASGMEMVLKLFDLPFIGFQELYTNVNIGFEHLCELNENLSFQEHWMFSQDALKTITNEAIAERFPLVSLSDEGGWHIYVALHDGHELHLLSRSFEPDMLLDYSGENLNQLLCISANKRTGDKSGKINFATFARKS